VGGSTCSRTKLANLVLQSIGCLIRRAQQLIDLPQQTWFHRVVIPRAAATLACASIITPAYRMATSSSDGHPDKLMLHQLIGWPSQQAGVTPAHRMAVPTSWCYTSSSDGHPNKLVLHQLIGWTSQRAGVTPAHRMDIPTSWCYTSSLDGHPDKLVLHQLIGWTSRQAGVTPAHWMDIPTSWCYISSTSSLRWSHYELVF
jgi:hypothetical protein